MDHISIDGLNERLDAIISMLSGNVDVSVVDRERVISILEQNTPLSHPLAAAVYQEAVRKVEEELS
jgi:hypothetical protein